MSALGFVRMLATEAAVRVDGGGVISSLGAMVFCAFF